MLHVKMSKVAEAHGLPSSRICLFFNDQDCLPQGVAALDALLSLKRRGFRVGIDIESLDALPVLFVERLPADVLRLGPLDAAASPGDRLAFSRIKAFTRFAENLLMTTAAGGVTSTEQVAFLRNAGINVGQGPFFSGMTSPLPLRFYYNEADGHNSSTL
jgi:EAL domain-containing protein (putative c-di-GMP-specific phosphodiesterase class I)